MGGIPNIEDDLRAAAEVLVRAAVRSGWGAARRGGDMVIRAAVMTLRAIVAQRPDDAHSLEQLAILQHNVGRLDAARTLYAEVNRLDPPHPPSDRQRQAMERLCPLLRTTSAECFPLRDCAAIHHPTESLVGYHLFWEDDWDYPDDDEPCDHEVVWVRYRPVDLAAIEVATYFHGRILTGDPPAGNTRPTIYVQWGKHGSLPSGWERLDDVETILRRDFESSLRGGRVPDHPRKQRWPPSFPGTWAEYVRFDRVVEPLPILRARDWYLTGRWVNAILHDYLVPYNFHAKREWPDDGLSNL